MSWGDLFDRAAALGVDEAAVRAALAARRRAGEASADADPEDAP